MDELIKAIEYFQQFQDQAINTPALIVAAILVTAIWGVIEFVQVKVSHSRPFVIASLAVGWAISLLVAAVAIWIFGGQVVILAVMLGIIAGFFLRNKYFKFLDENLPSEDEREHSAELSDLKKKFKKTPNFSILEVLLYYDYISPLQKETVEISGIFDTPDDSAKRLLTMSVLTERQFREAKAIMNVIRREGKILTKQDALLLVAKIQERGAQDEEDPSSIDQ